MFSTEEAPAHGVSAVKALALAGASGQKIWTIDQNNVAIAFASISHTADIESEIRNSVRAGNVATIHESPVAYQGGSYVGYTVIDPVTGAGAYKIGGGENGGVLENYPSGFVTIMLTGIGLLTAFSGPVGITAVLTLTIAFITIFHIYYLLFIIYLQFDLILIENGCPKIMRDLLLSITVGLFFIPKVIEDQLVGIVMVWASVIMKGAVKGASPACSP